MSDIPKPFKDFKWSFSTLGCPELTLDEICALAREFGLSWIELRATEGTVELPVLFKNRYGNPGSLARYLEDQQIGICSLDTSLKLTGNTEADRKSFLEFLPWADGIGTQVLRVFDGGTVADGMNDEACRQAQDTIEWWQMEKAAQGWQADMAFETHDCLVDCRSSQRLLAAYPDVKIIWDTHHTWKKSSDSLVTSWSALGPNVINTHIKDSISKPSARHPFSYVNLGEGEFPLEDALKLLNDGGYSGFVNLEWERMWHPYLPELKEALSKARALNWF